MAILSHDAIIKEIKDGKLKIDPFDDSIVRENGIDLRIGGQYAEYSFSGQIVDPCELNDSKGLFEVVEAIDGRIPVPPHRFVLLTTMEQVKFPDDLVGLCNLRSTLARYGLSISPTIIDAGFAGNVTIEIINNSKNYIILRRGMRFLHVVLERMEGKATYAGIYLGQKGVGLPKGMKGEC